MPSTETGTILVVDDDKDAAQNLGDILTDLGYQVGVAADGFSALDLARKNKYEIALLDLKMPGMDGLTLAQKLKQISCSMIVILTTAYASGDTLAKASQTGIWRVFSKPLDLSRMIPSLMEAAEQPLILLIDDDAELCQSLTDVLRDKDYRVCSATEIDQALTCVRKADFQVVLIDMKLSGGFGDEVFQQLRTITDKARVVLMTGHRDEMEDRIQRSVSAGADAVCYKPFQLPELLDTIHKLTEHRPAG